ISSLIDTIYSGIYCNALHEDQYYSERTILCSRNDDVDDINNAILNKFPGQSTTFHSADSIL
ncbi:hypothetical protein BJ912DRAFT_812424, partial [Pholiota molesta]